MLIGIPVIHLPFGSNYLISTLTIVLNVCREKMFTVHFWLNMRFFETISIQHTLASYLIMLSCPIASF